MSLKNVAQFSIATLLAVSSTVAVGAAALRPGFESWQVATTVVAGIVVSGACFGAAFRYAGRWEYWAVPRGRRHRAVADCGQSRRKPRAVDALASVRGRHGNADASLAAALPRSWSQRRVR